MKRAKKNTLTDFMRKHNVRYPKTIEHRTEAIREATPLTSDKCVIVPSQFMVERLAVQLKCLLELIAKIKQETARRY